MLSVVLATTLIAPMFAMVKREFAFTSVGLAVPIPTTPSLRIWKMFLRAESQAMNAFPVEEVDVAWISSDAPGVARFIPTAPMPVNVVEAMREVVEAWNPAWNHSGVPVAFVAAAKFVVGVKGNADEAEELIVIGEAPMAVNAVQVVPPEQLTLVVATPYTPAAPFDTKRLLEEGCVVVAKPLHVTTLFVPPTWAPSVPVIVKGPE